MSPSSTRVNTSNTRSSTHKQSAGLKPFTIISGEPKNIHYYLNDLSLPLYGAKSSNDMLTRLEKAKYPELHRIPLDRDSDYGHIPSPFHFVNCDTESCPYSNYVMCRPCKWTKEAAPKEGVTIECNRHNETLENCASDNEHGYCKCDGPDFPENNYELDQFIDNYCNSDACYHIIELCFQDSIQIGDHDDKPQTAATMSKSYSSEPFSGLYLNLINQYEYFNVSNAMDSFGKRFRILLIHVKL